MKNEGGRSYEEMEAKLEAKLEVKLILKEGIIDLSIV